VLRVLEAKWPTALSLTEIGLAMGLAYEVASEAVAPTVRQLVSDNEIHSPKPGRYRAYGP